MTQIAIVMMFIIMLNEFECDCYDVMLNDFECIDNKIPSVAACDHQVKMMPLGIDNLVLIDDEVNFDHQYKI